mmetsp:Transcript_42199/g.74031  ORF Transcript_42199/g.74031 Transcript_42199/m.74031 type:complete len:87 (-) Transcript_42199:119-379(-)
MLLYTKKRPVIKDLYESLSASPLKNPVTNWVFSAILCDFRVPSSSMSARPPRRGLSVSAIEDSVAKSGDRRGALGATKANAEEQTP